MSETLLVEVGLEELPARWVESAATGLKDRLVAALDGAGIEYGRIKVFATPRRLAVAVAEVGLRQPDREHEVRGPAVAIAFDDRGEPTKAALGFARGQGVDVEQLERRRTDAGEYVFARAAISGRPTREVLPGLLPDVITGVEFPASMRWGQGEVRYGRPIRWLVVLLGEEALPVELDGTGVVSGRVSRGHRSVGPVTIDAADQYEAVLESNLVVPSLERRRDLIRERVQAAASAAAGTAVLDDRLLDEVCCLVEYPVAVAGQFDVDYLGLPAELLVTVMTSHQRYFPVVTSSPGADPGGLSGREYGLMPGFVCVINGGYDAADTVARGHERVLRARLEDAAFFFGQDREQRLPDLTAELDGIVFFDRVGTVGDRVQRLVRLVPRLARRVGAGEETTDVARRAAGLAKNDLVTRVVAEFPELAGSMGRIYARQAGEPEPVAAAIGEHVLPRHPGDRLPGTMAGALVSLADRIDALVGFAAAGVEVSGSQDPFGLRRLAASIITLCDRLQLPVPVEAVVQAAIDVYGDRLPGADPDRVERVVTGLLAVRVRGVLEERGFRHDVVDAVLSAGIGRLAAAEGRARALTGMMSRPELDDLITVFRRTGHLAGEQAGPVQPDLFTEPRERELWEEVQTRGRQADDRLEAGDYEGCLSLLASLRPAVDRFFDDVLVMADDEQVRQNRLSLLAEIARRCLAVGDMRKLVIG